MHPSHSRGAISRFILVGVEIGYPDAVEIRRRHAKRQDTLNTPARNSVRYIGRLRGSALVLLFANYFANLEYISPLKMHVNFIINHNLCS